MRPWHKLFVTALIVVIPLIGIDRGHAATPQPSGIHSSMTPLGFSRYFDRRTGNVVFIKTRCIGAEDSAAHLKLLQFEDHGGRVVLGCYHHGY